MRSLGFKRAIAFGLSFWTQLVLAESPVIRAGLETEPTNLDWQTGLSVEDRLVTSMIMRGLFKYEKGKVVCDLCTSYGWSPDGRRIEVRLSTQINWSDGKRLTAQDFVFAYRRLRDKSSKGLVPLAAEALDRIQSFEALGESVLLIETKRLSTSLSHDLTRPVFFPVRSDFATTPEYGPVLGAFVLAAWEKGKRIVLEANPEYQLPRKIYRVDLSFGTHALLFEKYQQGRIDVLLGLRTEDVLAIKEVKQIGTDQIIVSPMLATRTLVMGQTKAKLPKLREFRKLFRLALDTDSLPATLGLGDRKSTGLIPPGILGYRAVGRASQDILEAERLRQSPTWKDQDLSIEVLARDESAHRLIIHWLQQRLARVRVAIRPNYESATRFAQRLSQGDFELSIQDWYFQTLQPLELLRTFRTSSLDNFSKFTSVSFDAVLEQLERAWGQDKNPAANLLLDQAMDQLEETEGVVVSLSYPSLTFLIGPRVKHFAFTSFGVPDITQIELKR